MTRLRGLAPFLRKIAPSDSDLLGRERGQAVLRVIVCLIVTGYLAWSSPAHGLTRGLLFAFAYVSGSALFAAWVLRATTPYAPRRYLANLADVTAITIVMSVAGPKGAALVLLYLWVTIGSGFRYGLPALLVSLTWSLLGFAIAAEYSGLLREHPLLASNIWLILLVLPTYTAHLIKVLHTALSEAREASAAKSQFLARMSHELRTPLNGITGAAELLAAGRRLTPDERMLLDAIGESVRVSLRQINGVLDFAKLQAGKLILEQNPFDLHEVLHRAIAIIQPTSGQKGLRLFVCIAPDLPYRLMGDAHQLQEILLNLLSNAVKFTEQGSVWLEASQLYGEDSQGDVTVVFEVGDTGIGIGPEGLGRIFEPFVQEDETTTRRYGGTGLGTSIAKQLVDLMGGRISVKSARGSGSVFRCEIPFRTQPSGDAENDSLSGVRCLLISRDNRVIRHVREALAHISVLTSGSDQEAIDALTRAARVGNPVHVLLVDAAHAIARDGHHWYQSLCAHAAETQAFPILLSELPVPTAQLRRWGYNLALPREPESATLRLTLRAYATGRSRNDKVVHLAPRRRAPSDKMPRILIADDNATNLMIVQRVLERAGYQTEAVGNGEAALSALETGRCQLGILDMHMPGLDGLTVVRRYRNTRTGGHTPIIILTANVGFDAMRDSAEAGAEAYLAKPVTAAALLNEVERLLQHAVTVKMPVKPAPAAVPVIDPETIQELDRIYHNPVELAALISTYEVDCTRILGEISDACTHRNHPLFCDRVHALKGNAANVGAMQLMALCQELGTNGIVLFMTEGARMAAQLKEAFLASIDGLRDLAQGASGNQISEQ